MAPVSPPEIVVVAALVEREGRMLLAERPAGVHLAGLSEFPGGKLEPGETPAAGLVRELREERGVEAHDLEPLTFVHHRYPERHVLLLLYACAVTGEPRPLSAARLHRAPGRSRPCLVSPRRPELRASACSTV